MDNIKNIPKNDSKVDPTDHIAVRSSKDDGKEFEVKELYPEDLDSAWLRWKCMVCGYLYEGIKELKKCPRCGNEDPDKFADAD